MKNIGTTYFQNRNHYHTTTKSTKHLLLWRMETVKRALDSRRVSVTEWIWSSSLSNRNKITIVGESFLTTAKSPLVYLTTISNYIKFQVIIKYSTKKLRDWSNICTNTPIKTLEAQLFRIFLHCDLANKNSVDICTFQHLKKYTWINFSTREIGKREKYGAATVTPISAPLNYFRSIALCSVRVSMTITIPE